MIELERCKLCNSAAKIMSAFNGFIGKPSWWVRCVNREDCGADAYRTFESEEEAVTRWNETNEVEE